MKRRKNALKKSKLFFGTVVTAALLASGCGDSENFVFTNTGIVNPGISAPLAVNDSFNALGNATLNRTAPNGVLTNDTLNGAEIIGFDSVGDSGGTLTLNADGSLNYTPVFGFVGAESFSYTIANAAGESTATVTFTSTASGFFVDNTAPDGGNGSQAAPFDTLAEAVAAANSGDTVFVATGNGTNSGLTGLINLPPGVDLIGQGQGLVVSQTIEPVGNPPVVQGPIVCGGDNTVSGLILEGSASNAIDVEGVGDVIVSNNTIRGQAEEAVFLTDTTSTVTISGNTFEDPPNTNVAYICSENADTDGDLVITDNIFTNASGNDVEALAYVGPLGNSVMDVTFSGNTANGTAADQFDLGLFVAAADTSQVDVVASDNTMNNFINEPVALFAGDPTSSVSGTVTGNTITNVSTETGVTAILNAGSLTVIGNIISGTAGPNIYIDVFLQGDFVIQNNQLSDSAVDNLLFEGGGGDSTISILDNTMTTGTNHSIHLDWSSADDLCAVITGNTVGDDLFLDQAGPGTFFVQDLNSLSTLNTLNGNIVDTQGNVVEGDCVLP